MLSIFSTADSIYGYTFKGTLFIIIEINFLTKPIKSVKKQLPNESLTVSKCMKRTQIQCTPATGWSTGT